MPSNLHESGDALRIELATSGRELIARPFGPLFRLVSVVGTRSPTGEGRPELRYATLDLDPAAVDALIVRLVAWRAEQT